jgi:hypothetical protein
MQLDSIQLSQVAPVCERLTVLLLLLLPLLLFMTRPTGHSQHTHTQ